VVPKSAGEMVHSMADFGTTTLGIGAWVGSAGRDSTRVRVRFPYPCSSRFQKNSVSCGVPSASTA